MRTDKRRDGWLLLAGYTFVTVAYVVFAVWCHAYWIHSLAHVFMDLHIILVAPMFYAAFFYSRRVFTTMAVMAVITAIIGLQNIEGEVRESILLVSIVGATSLFMCEMIHRAMVARNLAEEALRKTEERIIHLQKMEALGQLTAGLSHNFNNILTGVIGNLNLAKRLAEGKLKKYVDAALKSSVRAAELTNELAILTRRRKSQRQSVCMQAVTDEVADACRSIFDERIQLEISIPEELPPVWGNSGRIYQAILNLCFNARDAFEGVQDPHHAPRIETSLELVHLDKEAASLFPNLEPGAYVRIRVHDNGTGMDEKTQARVFEPFFTTKEVGKGTGLGLATVYAIVQSHHGAIECRSQPGQGTTFQMRLPVADANVGPARCISDGMPGGDETILLIDDEEHVRNVTCEMLEQYGYTVIMGYDGEEGVALFKNHCQEIGLVLMDLSMPAMDGHKALKTMRTIRPAVKAIAFTGHSINLSEADGFVAILEKPFDWSHLLQTVRGALDAPLQSQDG